MEIDSLTESIKTVSIDDGNKKYKKYTPEQVRTFIQIMQDEGTTVPKAADFNDSNGSNGSVLPGFAPKAKNRGTKQKLFSQHTSKSNIKRNPLDKADTLISRLPAACGSVTVKDIQGWVRHTETFWDRCINKELGLR
ncbi:hypothetical protein INT47_001848 [Mucor saturninus]|uniref:Uncharacterized protein n=1 Tax=Mucor saturninus TaxID=64648 RepID=A0A8H7REW0_9FUNG|nr:hypothetical protein INT47_001848 [Mucor saturninus]